MLCTNDQCSMPLQNLITDIVDGLGGLALPVKMLNHLGVCSSADTLARALQYRVTERENRGVHSECSSTAFTITVMLVVDRNVAGLGPPYSLFNPSQSICMKSLNPHNLITSNCTSTSEGMCGQLQEPHLLHRRRKHDVDRPYASPSSKSPLPKIQRRARTAMEAYKLMGRSKEHEVLQL